MKKILIIILIFGVLCIDNSVSHEYRPPSNRFKYFNCTSTIIGFGSPSIDILKKCKTIYGFLVLNKLDFNVIHDYTGKRTNRTDIYGYTLENLREITGFLLLYDVRGLTSLADLFPNLAIIRGKILNFNYGLTVYQAHDLKEIGLKSLLSVERGQFFIKRNYKLCNPEKVYWSRLTTSRGRDYIQSQNSSLTDCPKCEGCLNCWGEKLCQNFEGYDIVNQRKNSNCHPECFGGCYKENSNTDCFVCKNYNKNGTCVAKCPLDLYASDMDMFCYTDEDCISKNRYIVKTKLKSECVEDCPYGFRVENDTICVQCENETDDGCARSCDKTPDVDSLYRAELLKGCNIIQDSLNIRILDPISHSDLEGVFKDIRIIRGHLRIYESPYIKNLTFFSNLHEITGRNISNRRIWDYDFTSGHFALIIHENKNLTKLWNIHQLKKLKIVNNGIFIDSNPKLCNGEVDLAVANIEHDKKKDFIFHNDEEFFCDEDYQKFKINVQVQSAFSAIISWRPLVGLSSNQNVEIFYKEMEKGETLNQDDEIEKEDCFKHSWHKIKLNEYTPTNYNITNLKSNTRYVFIVNIYMPEKITALYQSYIVYAETQLDLPEAPIVQLQRKTYNLLFLNINNFNSYTNQNLTKFVVEIYKIPDNQTKLDKRNFCDRPKIYSNVRRPYFEKNASHKTCLFKDDEDDRKDEEFENEITRKYPCTVLHPDNCDSFNPYNISDDTIINDRNIFLMKKTIEKPTSKIITLKQLVHATLYLIKVFACNKVGCSSYTLHHEMTKGLVDGNKLEDITISRKKIKSNNAVYSIKLPKLTRPNGAILRYKYVRKSLIENSKGIPGIIFKCITNKEMEAMNYSIKVDPRSAFAIILDTTFEKGSYSKLRPLKEFHIYDEDDSHEISEEELDDMVTPESNIVIPILIFLTILIFAIIAGVYIFKRRPVIRSRILYNVQEDAIQLISNGQNINENILNEGMDQVGSIGLGSSSSAFGVSDSTKVLAKRNSKSGSSSSSRSSSPHDFSDLKSIKLKHTSFKSKAPKGE